MKGQKIAVSGVLHLGLASVCAVLLGGCVFSENPALTNSTSTLIKPGFVRICGPDAINQPVTPGDYCPIARVDSLGSGGYRVVKAYSDEDDSEYVFHAIDLTRDIALIQVDQRSEMGSLISREKGGPINYIYRLARKTDPQTFMVHSIECTFSSEMYAELAQQGISLATSKDCKIDHLNKAQFLSFFKMLAAQPSLAENDSNYRKLEQYSSIPDQMTGKAEFLAERKAWAKFKAR